MFYMKNAHVHLWYAKQKYHGIVFFFLSVGRKTKFALQGDEICWPAPQIQIFKLNFKNCNNTFVTSIFSCWSYKYFFFNVYFIGFGGGGRVIEDIFLQLLLFFYPPDNFSRFFVYLNRLSKRASVFALYSLPNYTSMQLSKTTCMLING